jgi:VanZ family protein
MPVLHFLFSRLSPQDANMMHGLIRKSAHFFVYFVLGLLLFHAFCGESSEKWSSRWAVYSVILVIFIAMSDEYHQSFIPSRTSSPVDVLIDSASGIFSQIVILLKEKTFNNISEG